MKPTKTFALLSAAAAQPPAGKLCARPSCGRTRFFRALDLLMFIVKC